eukprot:scaffold26468_cov58-Phaeocystis_antarctica.AAC.2
MPWWEMRVQTVVRFWVELLERLTEGDQVATRWLVEDVRHFAQHCIRHARRPTPDIHVRLEGTYRVASHARDEARIVVPCAEPSGLPDSALDFRTRYGLVSISQGRGARQKKE